MNDNEKKPSTLTYGLNDKLPIKVAIPLIIQQIVALSMDLVLPVLIISMIGGARDVVQNFVSLMMIGIGVGTLLQVSKKGPSGSGYLCAEETGFLYFQASSLAVQAGGLPLLCGMTVLSGLFQLLLSKIIQRIRFLFPTEVAGLMVAMTGIAGIAPGVSAIFGTSAQHPSLDITSTGIGLITLSIMVSLNVWGSAILKQYSIFVGIVLGYILSYTGGILTASDMNQLREAPLLALPWLPLSWSFDARLLPVFLIAVVCSSLKTMGNLAICQKANNAHWKRVDIRNVGNGVFAEGIGTSFCGIIGCMGLNSSSSSVGLSIATGVTSRHLAYLLGSVFIVMAFFPKTAALLSIMPPPVMGAVLLVNLGYFIIQGFQIITSRMLDDRKIFVVGLSLIFGLSVDSLPQLYLQFPEILRPFLSSSLTVVSLSAILLNLLFRIGIKQTRTLELTLGSDATDKVIQFMESNGAAWGARGEVIHRASSAIIEFVETAAELDLVSAGPISLDIRFDEYQLEVKIIYSGTLMECPKKRPTEEELLRDENTLIHLSGFMMRKYADKLETSAQNGTCVLQLRFDS
ncbi:MAG TPA: solute carrier family 23 protein [Patescibacteria group bacterium]|nr:solute carrier family 23 protein [Patescibacteria group bacterium]